MAVRGERKSDANQYSGHQSLVFLLLWRSGVEAEGDKEQAGEEEEEETVKLQSIP